MSTGEETMTGVLADVDRARFPKHVAVIMDGNGRWAQRRGLPRVAGHQAGMEAVKRTVRAARGMGVQHLTLYAFSTENWRRPSLEVNALWQLLMAYAASEADELARIGVRLHVLGDRTPLSNEVRESLAQAEEETAANEAMHLYVAVNYGGRQEIVAAARRLATDVADGRLRPEQIDIDRFRAAMYMPAVPDPDLLIRTAGEYRVSNFLLWQIAYTEIWITQRLWPDFSAQDLQDAVRDYAARDRRFGGVTGA